MKVEDVLPLLTFEWRVYLVIAADVVYEMNANAFNSFALLQTKGPLMKD